ncbi:Hsp70 family protein [Pelagibacterium sp. 26DY04]|uniref:Hsp70 family protein n=1 Tax=Pelagibacterium sp. 26DY04 TaxID=2967130 RepID=UPI0028157313|nr:Hsp70 family protein [Pelagibacterium sp. 26DY04]WMT85802.1 Hsp70 family protein [Pelagibacterium sp. 26DY04]
MAHSYCGIDFGTTNSTIGLAPVGQEPRLLAVEGEQVTIPSALFFSFEDHRTHFGRAAVAEYLDGAEGRFMRALKSILGSTLMDERTQIGRERVSFQQLIGTFIGHLRARLAKAGETPEKVVLGRPVFFVDDDEAADRKAQSQLEEVARAQGFAHVEFQFEPVAAALHFERRLEREVLALVVDIGGGTSDFSVLRLSPKARKRVDRREDILSTSGVHVGGTDFDKLLSIAKVMPQMGMGSATRDGKRQMPLWYFHEMATWHRINQLYTPQIIRDVRELEREAAEPQKLVRFRRLLESRSGHRLAGSVEAAKIELSEAEAAAIKLDEDGISLSVAVTRGEFELATLELTQKIEVAIEDALLAAGAKAEAIEMVILTGGGALVPHVRRAAIARFGAAAVADADQFGAVGLGLAADAQVRFG